MPLKYKYRIEPWAGNSFLIWVGQYTDNKEVADYSEICDSVEKIPEIIKMLEVD